MDIIRTTPEALRAKATQILDQGNLMKKTTDKMFDIIESINGNVWTGQTQLAYISQFGELADDATRMYEAVEALNIRLNEIADEYQKVEEDTSNIAQNLATEVFY